MKKRGRPQIELNYYDIEKLTGFMSSLDFLTKQQERFKTISEQMSFNEDEQKLIKSNLREMSAHQKRIETLEIIKFKTKTTQSLTDLEKEILSYDMSKRDDFFNCHKALNTYIRLEKITHNEIKRIDQKVRSERIQKVRQEQTEAQKQRTAENRNKYFIGASVARIKQIFGQEKETDLDFLKWLSIAGFMWRGADKEYGLTTDKYIEPIQSHFSQELKEIVEFIEQAKNDQRQ
ncbi:hypothetical protein F7P73_17080 [Acinetobacter bohemicus]|uniref:Uncharacterized protein n=1 Tax=Acinetobacter bohemicus TaxID=1435036 RepID=A0A1I6W986_9GAMM|nr:hypothetical protein [Acinetobacter bohemicus]KAB0650237.1 hypothetical protein F7P73_17080 [Acinetobacter bohemicus]SFT22563.1 hypothetical protein SAMN05444586_10487 [Acinetobacter bohemicus]